MADPADPPANPPKKKKPLAFLKPKPKPVPALDDDFCFTNDECDKGKEKEKETESDDGLSLFRRSKDFWPQLVKKEEETGPSQTTAPNIDRHTTDHIENESIHPSPRSSKRRKLSSPEPALDVGQSKTYVDLHGPPTPPRRSSKSATPRSRDNEQSSPKSQGKGKGKGKEKMVLVQSDLSPTLESRSNAPRVSPALATTIVLDDSDDDLIDTMPEPKSDEFDHFIVKLRKEREEAEAAAAAAAAALDASSDEEAEASTPNGTQARRKRSAPISAVKVFVQLRIKQFGVQEPFGCLRRPEQPMSAVKRAVIAWMRTKKGLDVSEEMEQNIFLTWKGRRIYERVSGLSLGWKIQANGKLDAPDRTPGYDRGGVLLEAWTDEDFERNEADQARQRLIARGELVEEGGGVEVADGDDEEDEPEVAKLRLYLKEKDKEPLRLTAKADTQIRVLIGAYRKQCHVPEDRDIRLRYDGDWLEPLSTVYMADIEDMCTVEVYLK